MTPPENTPQPSNKGFKLTLMQGVIGAVSLAGTTAIPILVQRALNSPTPAPSPEQTQPAQVQPAQIVPATVAPQNLSGINMDDEEDKGKGKKKGKKNH